MHNIQARLKNRVTKAEAIIETCQGQYCELLPNLIMTLNTLTWDEVERVSPYLPLLGLEAVEPLCELLSSERKQTIEAATRALAVIGDNRAAQPLVRLMETQAGQANALRARDALIQLGRSAVPALLSALSSAKLETRYYAVQALAIIGDPEVIAELVEVAEADRSTKVREAADQALLMLPSVGEHEPFVSQQGFYNPEVISPGFLPDWRVDVINGNSVALVMRYDLDEMHSYTAFPVDTCTGAVLRAYERMGDEMQTFDVVVLMGELEEQEGLASNFGIALLGLPLEQPSEGSLQDFIEALFEELCEVPGFIDARNYWLGRSNLQPCIHLQQGSVICYDHDDAYAPDAVQQDSDDRNGTGFTFTFAKAVLDQGWVYRSQLANLKEHGFLSHIPLPTGRAFPAA